MVNDGLSVPWSEGRAKWPAASSAVPDRLRWRCRLQKSVVVFMVTCWEKKHQLASTRGQKWRSNSFQFHSLQSCAACNPLHSLLHRARGRSTGLVPRGPWRQEHSARCHTAPRRPVRSAAEAAECRSSLELLGHSKRSPWVKAETSTSTTTSTATATTT